jgi:hypothetical protein
LIVPKALIALFIVFSSADKASARTSIALLSFRNTKISTKLAYPLCQKKFKEILELIEPKIVKEKEKELLFKIKSFSTSYNKLKEDSKIKKLSNGLLKLLKGEVI